MLAELCAATSINSSHTQACCLELQTACKHSADLRSLEPIREGNGFPAPADSRVSHWQSLLLHPCPAVWRSRSSDQCRLTLRVPATLMLCRFDPNAKGYHGDDQLDNLLRDPNVDAVAVVLPVQVMLQVDVCCKSGRRCSVADRSHTSAACCRWHKSVQKLASMSCKKSLWPSLLR